MKKEDITSGVVVRNTKTGKIGVPFTGHVYEKINPETEVPIVYQGDDKNRRIAPHFELTHPEDLEKYQLQPKDLLTEQHIREVCKPRTKDARGYLRDTCRYLFQGTFGDECAKVLDNFGIAEHIDKSVGNGDIKAMGNNCGGRYNIRALQRERQLLA
jgi:hypothetical protein